MGTATATKTEKKSRRPLRPLREEAEGKRIETPVEPELTSEDVTGDELHREEEIRRQAEQRQDEDVKVIHLGAMRKDGGNGIWTKALRLNLRVGPSAGETMEDERDPKRKVVKLGFTEFLGRDDEGKAQVRYFNLICLFDRKTNNELARLVSQLFVPDYRKEAQKEICDILRGRRVSATLKKNGQHEYIVLRDLENGVLPTETLTVTVCKRLPESDPVWEKTWETSSGLDVVLAITDEEHPLRIEMKDGKKFELR